MVLLIVTLPPQVLTSAGSKGMSQLSRHAKAPLVNVCYSLQHIASIV